MRIDSGGFDDLVANRMHEWQLRQGVGEQQPAAPHGPTPVLTLSRELGSGGREIAEAVSAQLRWDLWDRELVEEIARSANVREEVVQSLDEHARSEILAVARELLGERLGTAGYRRHLAQVILTIARHGSAVIVGRGASYILPNALNVRVIGSAAQRQERLARREGIPVTDAARRCAACDRERADSIRSLFDRDINDPLHYDLVVNTDKLQPEGATAVIIAAVKERFPG